MPMYAISLIPLIRQLSGLVYQVWYADDLAAGGSCESGGVVYHLLVAIWDILQIQGRFG